MFIDVIGMLVYNYNEIESPVLKYMESILVLKDGKT